VAREEYGGDLHKSSVAGVVELEEVKPTRSLVKAPVSSIQDIRIVLTSVDGPLYRKRQTAGLGATDPVMGPKSKHTRAAESNYVL
jgi:hypothetical protein